MAVDALRHSRKYTDVDVAEIHKYMDEYKLWISTGNMQSTSVNSEPREKALSRVRAVYCTCIRKLGLPKCIKSGAKLTGADRVTWSQGNAAEMAIKTSYVPGNTVDPEDCE